MNIVDRLTTLAKANINNLLARAEDPEKILDQLILDMQSHYRETKVSVAEAIASEKRLERQTRQTEALAAQWEKKAMMAVRAGRDDLAKEALRRKGEQDVLASDYRTQLELANAMSEQLKDGLRKLDSKLAEARRKRTQLIMRAKQVQAMERMQAIQENLSNDTAFSALARVLTDHLEPKAWRTSRAEVRGHHEHRARQIDGLAQRVRQAPLAERLQQQVEHGAISLLDLIEEDHLEGLLADPLDQLSGLSLIAPDQTTRSPGILILGHVKA